MVAAVVFPAGSRADRLVAAGRAMPGEVKLIPAGEEMLAPLLPALAALGVKAQQADQRLELVSPRGTRVTFTLGKTTATVDGKERKLLAAPVLKGKEVYLPVGAVADIFDYFAPWSEERKTLSLIPKVLKVDAVATADRVTVRIEGTAPLTAKSGSLVKPDRLYFDFAGAYLVGPASETPLTEGPVTRVRCSQHSVDPDVVRVVFELKQAMPFRLTQEQSGCVAVIDVPPPKVAPIKIPPTLTRYSFERLGARGGQLTIGAIGRVSYEALESPDSRRLTLRIPGARCQVARGPWVTKDPMIEAVTCDAPSPDAEAGIVNITISWKQPTRHAVEVVDGRIRVVWADLGFKDMRVVIDPGHGGPWTGAVGRKLSLVEKEVNLDIAKRFQRLLQDAGVQASLTRESDTLPGINWTPGAPASKELLRADLRRRIGLADEERADVFVAIHCNSCNAVNSKCGTETYYNTLRSAELAQMTQQEMVKALQRKNGGVRGEADLLVVREAKVPAVLAEVSYLNYYDEEALLATPEFRQKAAQGLFNAMKRYAEESAGFLLRHNYDGDAPASPSAAPVVPSPPAATSAPIDR
jgi:N-acetylmuramoyl-L-alanine amidase